MSGTPDPRTRTKILNETGTKIDSLAKAKERLRKSRYIVDGQPIGLASLANALWQMSAAATAEMKEGVQAVAWLLEER